MRHGLPANAVFVADQQCAVRVAGDRPGRCQWHALRGVPVFDPFVAGPAHQAFAIDAHPHVAFAVDHHRVAAALRQPVAGIETAPVVGLPAHQPGVTAHQHAAAAVQHQWRWLADGAAIEHRQWPYREVVCARCAVHDRAHAAGPQPTCAVAQHAVPTVIRHALLRAVDLHLALRIDRTQLAPAAGPQGVVIHRQAQHLGQVRHAHPGGGVQQRFAMPAFARTWQQAQQGAVIGQHGAPRQAGQQHAVLQVVDFSGVELAKAALVADEQALETGHPQAPVGRFAHRRNGFVAQAIQWRLLKIAAIEAIQPGFRTHPQQCVAGLQQAGAS